MATVRLGAVLSGIDGVAGSVADSSNETLTEEDVEVGADGSSAIASTRGTGIHDLT